MNRARAVIFTTEFEYQNREEPLGVETAPAAVTAPWSRSAYAFAHGRCDDSAAEVLAFGGTAAFLGRQSPVLVEFYD